MGMVVRTNTMAVNANRQLASNNTQVGKSLEKLSSGFRINRAGDDASGLAISEKMKAQIKGLEQASANSQDGISLIQTAEGNLTEVHDMLNRMVELAEKSANGILEQVDRNSIQEEMDALCEEIDRIADSANFNNIKLFDGSLAGVGAVNNGGGNGPATTSVTVAADKKATTGIDNYVVTPKAGQTVADGALKVTATTVSATAPTITTTATQLKATAAGNTDVLNGYTVTFKKGTSSSGATAVAVDQGAKSIVFTMDTDVAMATDANVKAAVAGATGWTAGTDDALKTALAGITWGGTAVKSAGTANDLTGDQAMSFANGVGAASTKITIEDANGTIAEETIANSSLTNGVDVTVHGNKADVKITIGAAGAGTLTGGVAQTTVGTVATTAGGGAANSDPTITGPTSKAIAATKNGAVGTAAVFTVDVSGISLDKAGKATFDIFGDKYVIDVAEADKADAGKIAKALVDAINAKKPSDATGGEFTAATANPGTSTAITLTAANAVALTDTTKFKAGNITVEGGDKSAAAGNGLLLQIGDTNDSYNQLTVSMDSMKTSALFTDANVNKGNNGTMTTKQTGTGVTSIDISDQAKAGTALKAIRNVIDHVSTQRGKLGALQNRLEHTINNLDVTNENMTAANSRIRDTDMAKEMMNYTKMNVLVQSAQAMLAQANQQPQSILQLLQ